MHDSGGGIVAVNPVFTLFPLLNQMYRQFKSNVLAI
jgi:hypothetical protein